MPLLAQPAPSEGELRAHIAYLADDDLAGRRPGTEGERLSAEYIAAAFAEIGLRPAYEGGFLQPVELVERRIGAVELAWSGHGETAALTAADAVALGRSAAETLADAPVLLLGYGREQDLAAADVEGAVVLLITGGPGIGGPVASFAERSGELARRGAAAILALTWADSEWEGAQWAVRHGQTVRAAENMAPIEGMLAPAAAERLLAAAGYDIDQIGLQAARPEFVPAALDIAMSGTVETAVYPYRGHNVAARLPGSGGEGEAVLLLAHHDHLGLCAPQEADRICNGAVDNASGISAMIEIARALASGDPPGRDVHFLATTAEELGLLGIRAFVDAPPIPAARFVAASNLDTVATSPAGSPLVAVGWGMTPLDPVIEAVAERLGRDLDRSGMLNAFVPRQDGKILLDAGIPTVMVGGIDAAAFERFLRGPYHSPADELAADLDLSGLREDVVFQTAFIRALADRAQYPPPPR